MPGYPPTHESFFSADSLRRMGDAWQTAQEVPSPRQVKLWDKGVMAENTKRIKYDDYMTDDRALFAALSHLDAYGLIFLYQIPDSEQAVEAIAGRIGPLKETFYGRTWDVKSKPQAKNIAYTDISLEFHQDLLYMTNPPHLQFLHALRARAPGGASLFTDALRAARVLQSYAICTSQVTSTRGAKSWFDCLCDVSVPYYYKNDGHHYHFRRSTIELEPRVSNEHPIAVRCVNWSPPFQGVFDRNMDQVSAWHDAARKLQDEFSKPENIFEHRLEEGECVVFDNRRVLHARAKFDASEGERWLKGAYLDDDVFFSKARVLSQKLSKNIGDDGRLDPSRTP